MKTTAAEEIGSGLTQFLGLATVAVVFLIGTYFVVVRHDLDGPSFILFTGLLTQVFRPLKGASKVSSKIQRGLAGCDRVFAVLDQFPKIVDKPGASAVAPLKDALSFNNVTFHYNVGQPAQLKNINLRIPAGSAIALVGETGSGKSTMANLIPRFFDVTEGSLTYDDVDVKDVQIKSLRSQLAIVTQDVVLFDDSVANNIAYGLQRNVGRQEIEEAAKAARAHDFIMRLPKGYDTTIGSRGSRLSGGERQRLAIARAILKDAPILILDEATSALDSETESLIQEALTNLIKGRTTIIIAHRLSTIRNCDRIYVLDNGRIIEEGSHAELLNREGRYARFHNYQFAEPVGK
jgi:subfamily B ATP-binding cassette protein MsbA